MTARRARRGGARVRGEARAGAGAAVAAGVAVAAGAAVAAVAAACGSGARAPAPLRNRGDAGPAQDWASRARELCVLAGGETSGWTAGVPLRGVTYGGDGEGFGNSDGSSGASWRITAPPVLTRAGVTSRYGATRSVWLAARVPPAELCEALRQPVTASGCTYVDLGGTVHVARDVDGAVLSCAPRPRAL